MKKTFKYLLCIMICLFFGMLNAKAASITNTTTSKNPVSVGKTFNVNISSATGNSGYTINYDTNMISTISNSCGSGSTVNKSDCEITFYVNSGLKLTNETSVTITLIDRGSGATFSTTAYIKANVITTTAASTTTTVKKSSNANLKTLEIKGDDGSDVAITPAFNATTYDYTANVSSSISKVTINATMEDAKSNLVLSDNATQELKAGEDNKIVLTVTAEDGNKKAYNVVIKKEALNADATLKTLTIKELPSFKLKNNVYKYTVKLANGVTKLTLSYKASNENAKVSVTGNKNLKDGSSIKIDVTAQDGTKKEYILTVSKTVTTTKSKVTVTSSKDPLVIIILSVVGVCLLTSIIVVAVKKD